MRNGSILRPAPGSPGKAPLGELPGAGRRQLSRQVSSVWLLDTTGVLWGSQEKRNVSCAALSGDALCGWWVVQLYIPCVAVVPLISTGGGFLFGFICLLVLPLLGDGMARLAS